MQDACDQAAFDLCHMNFLKNGTTKNEWRRMC